MTGRFSLLILTLGDPHSINIEALNALLATRAQARGLFPDLAVQPIIVCGSYWHWRDQEARGGGTPTVFESILTSDSPVPRRGLHFFDIGYPDLNTPAEALSSLGRGRIAVAALTAAQQLIASEKNLERIAVVTGPIDKYACHEAGFKFPGQTEFFESAFEGQAVMLLAGPRLRVGLVTNHLNLSEVSSQITSDLIVKKGAQLARTLRTVFGIDKPRIAVCGLNPHASDNSLFGNEERLHIAPAIEQLNQCGSGGEFGGPYPADTVFYRALQGKFDAVLAMYHDQGLGPLKTVHFDDGVNISGGLKHLRVSPDHGPARDLFLARKANTASFAASLILATRYLSEG